MPKILLIKLDIFTNQNFESKWMISFDHLKLIKIADHNAPLSFWIKLGSMFIKFMHIHNTTLNPQMFQLGRDLKQFLIWGHPIVGSCGWLICKIVCNANHINPKKPRGLCINHHQTSLLKKCMILTFRKSIVSWCVSLNQLMGDAYFSAKGEEISWNIFSPVIVT